MKLRRDFSLLRSIKFTPLAIISIFFFSNFTGLLMSRVFAPLASGSALMSEMPTSGDPDLDRAIIAAGEREGVDPTFIHAVIWQESKYDSLAHSHAGAQGLMQLMPGTAKRFGCKNVNDPIDNLNAGTKYLSWLLHRFSGNVELALAGYNAGEGTVDKYNGIPPFTETQNYVKSISARYGKSFGSVLSAAQTFPAKPKQSQTE